MSAEIINLKDALARMVGVPSPLSRAAQRAEWLLWIYEGHGHGARLERVPPMTKPEIKKPMTASEMWKAGYRQHPVTKEWLPRDEVVAAVEALKKNHLQRNRHQNDC